MGKNKATLILRPSGTVGSKASPPGCSGTDLERELKHPGKTSETWGQSTQFPTYKALPNWQELIGYTLLKVNSLLENMKGEKRKQQTFS